VQLAKLSALAARNWECRARTAAPAASFDALCELKLKIGTFGHARQRKANSISRRYISSVLIPLSRVTFSVTRKNNSLNRIATFAGTRSFDPLRGNDSRSTAEKWIQYYFATLRRVEKGVGDHLHWLYGRMHCKEVTFVGFSTVKTIRASVLPDVGPVAAVTSEFDIVTMWPIAILTNIVRDGTGRMNHASIRFDPYAFHRKNRNIDEPQFLRR
jgi:hypothetical protein